MTAPRNASPPERARQLFLVTAAPIAWMVHFVLSYITASVWCARFSQVGGTLGLVHPWVAIYTVAALLVIALVGWSGYRRTDRTTPPHDDDTPEDRHRFLGYATMLLAALSGVATMYSVIAVFTFRTC